MPGASDNEHAEHGRTPSSVGGTSQCFEGGTEVTTHGSLPGLARSDKSGPVESVATSMGMRELDQRQRLLIADTNQGNALTADVNIADATPLECPLKTIFGCRLVFDVDHEGAWINHSFAHFKALDGRTVQPPQTNKCCFCDVIISRETGEDSWIAKLEHIRMAHHFFGHRMAAARPDFELVRYLWGANAIDNTTMRDWTARRDLSSPPSSPECEPLPPVSHVQERRHRDRRGPSLHRGRR